jgi:hypothetical protein
MNTRKIPALALLASAFLLLTIAAKANDGPWLAQKWDSPFTLPPGGYAGAHAIDLTGDLELVTNTGTLLQRVDFEGSANGQHWHMNGTILQKVTIAGQLGVSMDANGCVFEDCDMKKIGGWFVDMWGTHWHFNNCIFTGKFMQDPMPVADYQIRANHCTFYGIKLPTVSLRKNPADYLQKPKQLSFADCRFVHCNVPESFLAATVDCVFEDCTFPPKHDTWPKEMTSLEVKAMYAGDNTPPESYLNGPLSVRFAEAPFNVVAGSALRHSVSGETVTLDSFDMPTEFASIGSVPKSSSQIAPPGVQGASNLPSAAVQVHSFDDILKALPASTQLITQDQPNIDGIDAANDLLKKKFTGMNAEFQVEVDSVETSDQGPGGFHLFSTGQSLTTRGVPLIGQAIVYPRSLNQNSNLKHGDAMKFQGQIYAVAIQGRGHDLSLVVTLTDAVAN